MPRRQSDSQPFPFPWEQVVWSAGPSRLSRAAIGGEQYLMSDSRIAVCGPHGGAREMALYDIRGIEVRQTRWQRGIERSDLVIHSRRPQTEPIRFASLSWAEEVSFVDRLLEIGPSDVDIDEALLRAAVRQSDRRPVGRAIALIAPALVIVTVVAVAVSLQGRELPIAYSAEDPIDPAGHKRSRAEIVAFMQRDVMPVARAILGPLEGGADRVTCETCHGRDAEARDWKMPAVRALPEPRVRDTNLERYAHAADSQLRNAIYGYLAEDGKQGRAGYMRTVVMPQMAMLLKRPPYDFTRSYSYNRSHHAFGCYHCHLVDRSQP